ncbi:MAG: hypothetical protein AABY22_11710 [Nanoarchaeota archaeon]
MPQYSFKNPENGQELSLIMGMNDNHEYYDINGLKWERIWFNPQTADNLKFDAFSSQNFVEKTNKKGTIRDLWNRSAECSEIRKSKLGIDPIKEKYIQNWEKTSKKEYPEKRIKKATEKLDKMGIEVTD